MSDQFLRKSSFEYKDGKTYGPDPNKAYAGDPSLKVGGWYVFANPIVEAAEQIISEKDQNLVAKNVSGSTKEELLTYIEQGIPVVMWVTLDLSPPQKDGGWYIKGTNSFHESYTNLHAVVLNGWTDGEVDVMNPLQGQVNYTEEDLFNSYQEMGRKVVIVKERN